jgi:biopolymer transport protein ExbB/TolQ
LFNSFSQYLSQSSAITILVLLILSFYFIITFWVFMDRFKLLHKRIEIETDSLKALYMGASRSVSKSSLLHAYLGKVNNPNSVILEAAASDAVRIATRNLTLLSIIASTSPFIGLFGTVVGILETFSKLGDQASAALNIVAPAISEALVATAAGILVAIFAYSFHLILKRKAYELSSLLASQSKMMLAQIDDK